MRSLGALLSLVSLVLATPVLQFGGDVEQHVLGLPTEYPGYTLDLNEMRLVELEGQSPKWVSELEKIRLKANGINFLDITDTQDLGTFPKLKSAVSYPKPNATEKVRPILKSLSTEGPKANLEKFTSFRTRYYRSDTGKQSQQWLLKTISEITAENASSSLRKLITVNEFPHSWGQNSIIVRINGSSATENGVVVIGAHQDSTNMWPFLPAPGADDDGSGTVTILEAYRALIAADFRPVRAVEFHWYSAEEAGLLGSQAVAQEYERRGENVIAMSQFDMTAWVKRGTREEVGIITDFVDSGLTEFNMQLVDTYLDIPYVGTKCGYACSDHASWSKAGYPSSFTIESAFENSNKHIHSVNDRIDISDEFSFTHMLEFSKLAVAFAVELGGWSETA
ncbi:peptidase [Coprinopsis cinerea okayama7|uniref:Peptide hydrolase n=1 Tax=Coprinopsis cinerea (strain Okayama-7 / 130 / ATCC MYA-4618 / FGSC 9003) TaxID=240176 RepID=A8NY39_COPC7|nr:peptidase [Coprinopsis cinerea okayama7\|eukprot:XP_001837336.1 peptidase [Coprinopsis cinerea okayama7\